MNPKIDIKNLEYKNIVVWMTNVLSAEWKIHFLMIQNNWYAHSFVINLINTYNLVSYYCDIIVVFALFWYLKNEHISITFSTFEWRNVTITFTISDRHYDGIPTTFQTLWLWIQGCISIACYIIARVSFRIYFNYDKLLTT